MGQARPRRTRFRADLVRVNKGLNRFYVIRWQELHVVLWINCSQLLINSIRQGTRLGYGFVGYRNTQDVRPTFG